jgi:SAM-dependent methyltransferase
MKPEEVWKVYDAEYALAYNERYLLNPFTSASVVTELSVLQKLIDANSRWLDLGCGTGYFLSQFPGTCRAGLDISPEMLKLASEANPDALFFKQGDFRKKMPEWEGAWSLVSCMWGAYNYVDSMKELEQLVTNMIDWVCTGGAIFIPVMDIEDIRPNMLIPYEQKADVFGGTIYLTSATWTWKEDLGGKVHTHLVAPHVEHLIKLLEPWFDNVELVRYPPYMTGCVSRKALIATERRVQPNYEQCAKITKHEIPPPETLSAQRPVSDVRGILSSLSHKQLIKELFGRIFSGRLFYSLGRKIFSRVINLQHKNENHQRE